MRPMQADPATLPRAPRQRRTVSDRLREALMALADAQARIASHLETAWASITFAGTRHRLELLFEGMEAVTAGETFITELPEHEFAIPGQLNTEATKTQNNHHQKPPRQTKTNKQLLLED